MTSGSRADEPGRSAAYADLVAAVLDLRDPASTREFDALVAAAVADGRLAEPLGRELRSLQRQSIREVVEHAAHVLPATLVALESGTPALPTQSAPGAKPLLAPDAPVEPASPAEEPTHEPPAPLVDLTARRLLVAGLRPLDDPPFP